MTEEKVITPVVKEENATGVVIQRNLEEIKAGVTDIRGTVTKLEADQLTLTERLQRQEEFTQRNLRDNPDGKGGIRKVDLARFLQGMESGNWKGADFEKGVYERSDETKRELGFSVSGNPVTFGGERVLTSTPVGTGGGFVSAQYLANELIEPLLPQLVMRAMGSRVLSGLTGGPVQIPRIITQSVPTAVLEGANKPNNEPVDQLPTMNPHEIGVYVEVSR
jgi:HK97 family phage major capsid protein